MTKEKRKCFQLVEKALSALLFEIEMDKSDQTDRYDQIAKTDPSALENMIFIDYDKEFQKIIIDYVVKPFGKDLN